MEQNLKLDFLLYCFDIGAKDIEKPHNRILSDSELDTLLGFANNNRVTPLLYHHLAKKPKPEYITPDFIKRLKDLYLYSLRINARIYNELSKVLNLLNENNIPTIVLKGGALAELYYKDIALRPMYDIDLIFKPEDTWRIDKVLAKLGYISDALSEHHVQWLPHICKNQALELDVNPSIFELPKLNPWTKARPARIASKDTYILGPEDFILHISLHLDRHYMEDESVNLIWWFDVKKLLERYINEINWNYMAQVAKEYEVGPSMYRILNAIDRWFGISIPPDAISQFKSDGAIASVIDILCPPVKNKSDYKELDSIFSSFSSTTRLPSFRKKVYHIFKRMFPDKECIIQIYSVKRKKLVYLYYFVRGFHVFLKGIKALLRLPIYIRDKYNSKCAE